VHGVPRILAVFDELGINATFALTTGPDKSLFNAIHFLPPVARLLGFNRKIGVSSDWTDYFPKVFSNLSSLQALKTNWVVNPFDSKPFIKANENHGIVKAIESKNHEIILHGHDHFKWANSLERLSSGEQKELLNRGIAEFVKLVGRKPRGFAAPAFNITHSLQLLLKEKEFVYCSNYSSAYQTVSDFQLVKDQRYCLEIPVFDRSIHILHGNYLQDGHLDSLTNRISRMKTKAIFFYLHAGIEGFMERTVLVEFLGYILGMFSTKPVKMIDYSRSARNLSWIGIITDQPILFIKSLSVSCIRGSLSPILAILSQTSVVKPYSCNRSGNNKLHLYIPSR